MALNITPAILTPTSFVLNPAAVLYTVVSGSGAVVKKGSFANTGNAPMFLTLYRVASGDVIAQANEICTAINIPANSVYVPSELINLVLGLGDAIWGVASTTQIITATISGFQFTL